MNPIVTSDQEQYNNHLIVVTARQVGDAWTYDLDIQLGETKDWLPSRTDNDHVYDTSEAAVRAGMEAGRGIADN